MSNSKESPRSMKSDSGRKIFSILAIIGLAVVFAIDWGPGSRGCDPRSETVQQDAAATVNGRQIPLRDFARAYANQMERFRAQGVPTELAKQFGLSKQVLDSLVNTELLAQAAEARGLAASDEDVRDLIVKDPSFQTDGKFDPARYHDVLQGYENVGPVAYEAKLRRQLSAQRMVELVEASAVVSEDEVHARYEKEGNAAKATFVRFNPAQFADKVPAPKPAEVEAFAKAHEKEIAAYYELNKLTYAQPERVRARQILLRYPENATDAQKAEVKEKAENLRKDLVDNKRDFAAEAKQFSEDTTTKEKGGDLGLIERLNVPGAFADALFALQPGEVTQAVESPLGWHIGTVSEKLPASQKPLDQVRTEIATQLFVRDQAQALARAAAEKALAELKAGKKLAELFPAKAAPEGSNPFAKGQEDTPEAKETGEFTASADAIPLLGAAPAAQKAIFALTAPGPVDQVVPVGDAFAVIEVTERKVPSDAQFAEQKAQLTLEAEKAKQFEVREAFLKALKESGKIVVNDKAIDRVTGEG